MTEMSYKKNIQADNPGQNIRNNVKKSSKIISAELPKNMFLPSTL